MILHSVSEMWTAIAPGIGNHLWQSTLFMCVAGLLTVILRKNQARARYWLWLTASVKFLIPFSLLVGAGSHLALPHTQAESKTGMYFAMEQVSLPFADPAMLHPTMLSLASTIEERGSESSALDSVKHFMPTALLVVWLCGSVVVLYRWWARWRRVAAVVREAEPLSTGREVEMLRRLERIEIGGVRRRIEMVASGKSMEPGVFGIVRPVLVWPKRISERLNEAHLEAVLAHEILHVRRRDNLSAAIHMVVETIFWFHPMVWWLGTRLVEERERACDEEVLRLCNRPQVYAESILKVCEFCVESPLACVSGVTGSDLKKRIVNIMTEQVARRLNFGRKLLLVATGSIAIAVPVLIGAMGAPVSEAQQRGAVATVQVVKAIASPVRAIEMKALPMLALVEPAAAPEVAAVSQAADTPPTSTTHAAGDIGGTWQGTLEIPNGKLRIVLKITKADSGGWSAVNYSIDQGGQPMSTTAVVLQGTAFKFSVPSVGGSYEGTLSGNGNSIVGTWTQGMPLPLTFVRATKETAWEIPTPPPPMKRMAADANPSFEVATIKPSDPAAQGKGFRVNGRKFSTIHTSLNDLIQFAYDVHTKQIIGGPDWLDKDKYDIDAVPDSEGAPSYEQWKAMVQKLLADRFKLTFHHDKKELSVYVLTVGKNGPKNIAKSESTTPGFSIPIMPTPGGIMMAMRNATMTNFAVFGLQGAVLDRPVLDQTGLTDRFDFTLKWMPDDSQFGGRMRVPPSDNPAPGLFTAIQEQLDLKLDATKAPADVMVIDHVEKPSEN